MTKPTGPTNPILRKIARKTKKKGRELDVRLWKELGERLLKPRRSRAEVNISRINRHTEGNDTVVVPGKVLGSGRMDHSVTVVAFKFSSRAKRRIQKSGGKTMKIGELLEENPEGKGVILME